jgi:DNA invertase Pin-like site-specific DNA recombinase
MGRAGIVLGLEVSRLARNSTDWHRLLEICALSNTLILDEDGVYDPAHFNDRLLLGLKGTMSEAELHVLRARLHGGLLNKARRGELHCRLPIGFVYDEGGRVLLDPDKEVQESVRLFFQTFERTGAVHATIKYFREQGLLFPTRLTAGGKKGELAWGPLSLNRAAHALHNPWYAGAFAFGRGRWRKQPDGRVRHERLPQEEWQVLIRDAHPGYISWLEYERISSASQPRRQSPTAAGPPRRALLQGRAVCGLCSVGCVTTARAAAGSPCQLRVRGPRATLRRPLQSILGTAIDAAVRTLLVEAVTPMALELALAVQQEIQSRCDEADRLRHRQVERAQYEADRARHRYLQVDPANRLVADSLEADWNARLRALAQAQQEYAHQRTTDRLAVDEDERRRILALATDFSAVWRNPHTPHRERKRMLALLVVEDVLLKQRQVTAAIRSAARRPR